MRKLLPAAASVALLCSSCLPVPFDLSLSQGAASASKMARDNPSLVTLGQGFDSSARDFVFYPAVRPAGGGMDYASGFVASVRNLEYQVQAVKKDPSSGLLQSYGFQSQPVPNPDAHFPAAVGWPVQPGAATLSYFFQYTFDALDPQSGSRYSEKVGDPSASTFFPVAGADSDLHNQANLDFPPLDSVVLGASVSADPGGLFDVAHWLAADVLSPGFYLEMSYHLDENGLGAKATPRNPTSYDLSAFLPVIPPSTLSRLAYFYDDNQLADPARMPNRSFASWYDESSGGWVCYAWDDMVSHRQLPIDHRLDALLSTGELLSTESGTGRLYNRDGGLLATFPLGNLVYLGEKYVGGAARCYFSQCLIYDHTLHFNVYWIATDKLATLVD